ncbi:MAG: hypothetical protein SFT92_03710 [Rickettsiales bacterium]|nr:hypothetical protein [Rickettsiales bacterium]
MDALGNISVNLPGSVSVPAPRNTSQPLPTPDVKIGGGGQESVDLKAADARRLQAVQRQAQANVYVVSDRTFTIFKDATGQYVTRFTSLRDGKVTYIPEPNLIRQSAGSILGASLNLKA